MKRKSSVLPAGTIEPQEEPNPTARVSIIEVEPNSEQIEEWIKDPAHRSGFVQQWIRYRARLKKRAKSEAGLKAGNQARQRDAAARYQYYRDIAKKLRAQGKRWRSRNRLAQLVQDELKKLGETVSIRTVLRAFEK